MFAGGVLSVTSTAAVRRTVMAEAAGASTATVAVRIRGRTRSPRWPCLGLCNQMSDGVAGRRLGLGPRCRLSRLAGEEILQKLQSTHVTPFPF